MRAGLVRLGGTWPCAMAAQAPVIPRLPRDYAAKPRERNATTRTPFIPESASPRSPDRSGHRPGTELRHGAVPILRHRGGMAQIR